MRRSFVAGNWKMNGTRASVAALLESVKSGAQAVSHVDIAVCPPFVYIPEVAQSLKNSNVKWGSQNVAKESNGAFTGEISVAMLKEFSCTYAIVGHSERRAIYDENDEVVAQKFKAALAGGIVPILCVGETLQQREAGQTSAIVESQLKAVVDYCGIGAFKSAVIAYEPVWAIGTGRTASPQQAQDVHHFIRQWLAAHDATVARGMQILYGGSVKGSNAKELFSQPDIDGGLIGGASLDPNEFLTICRAAK